MALLAEIEAESARLAGLRARTLAAIEAGDTTSRRWAREEAALVMRVAPVTATAYVKEAVQLVTVLPATLAALESGAVTALHARTLVEATYGLDDQSAGAVQSRCLAAVQAGRARSVGLFRQLVRRAVGGLAPTGPDAAADTFAQRRVCFRAQPGGTAEVWALLPALDAARLKVALDAAARASRHLPDGTPDPRTADQRRADALTDLTDLADLADLTTSAARGGVAGAAAATGAGPAVQVTVAASTLLGLDELPGHLDGHGPIPAAMARAIAADTRGTWRRILADPAGRVVEVSASYAPPAALRRLVIARDRHCRFPGCTRPARSCEIDHITAHTDGGPTSAANLHPLCPRHHHLKHDTTGWTVHQPPRRHHRLAHPQRPHHHHPTRALRRRPHPMDTPTRPTHRHRRLLARRTTPTRRTRPRRRRRVRRRRTVGRLILARGR